MQLLLILTFFSMTENQKVSSHGISADARDRCMNALSIFILFYQFTILLWRQLVGKHNIHCLNFHREVSFCSTIIIVSNNVIVIQMITVLLMKIVKEVEIFP